MENYQLSTLANGVQVVSESIEHVKSVSLGIWVRVGSRYENEKNNGVTHFIEHMLFKGTENRSAKEIAEEVDSMGGQLNAFTAKEYTCYYIRMIDENLAQGMDILADMLLKSKLDENDIDKERSVIEEEIKMYADAPDELANDLFNNLGIVFFSFSKNGFNPFFIPLLVIYIIKYKITKLTAMIEYL